MDSVVTPEYNWLYLSPHLDDVALSCGGQIAQQTRAGESVLIVTVMAGEPERSGLSTFAQSLHERWELAETAVAARRREDLGACHILGADALHWEIADCIYRMHPESGEALYQSDGDIFGEVAPVEARLVRQVAHLLGTLPSHRQMVVPLTVGHHVDHQVVRAGAELFHQERTERCPDTPPLIYYEDYPYAQKADALAKAIGDPPERWQASVIALSTDALETKIKAIGAFVSQLSTFFVDEQDLRAQVEGFVLETGGERLWCRSDMDATSNLSST